MYICMYVYMYVYLYTCIHAYIYLHTHIVCSVFQERDDERACLSKEQQALLQQGRRELLSE